MRETMRDIFGAIVFLAALALAYVASAQPQLHIVHGREGYPTLPGLTGLAPHGADPRCMTIWSYAPGWKLLALNVEVVNVGDQAWTALSRPELVYFDWWSGSVAVRAFFRFSAEERNRLIRELWRDYRAAAQEAAEDAYRNELERW